jgi:hypothetical protein
MSDSFQLLVDVDAILEEAPFLAESVVNRLDQLGLIVGPLDSECVLGGVGYRPGARAAKLYRPSPREGRFWELKTCGVEPITKRSFNEWMQCDYLECHACRPKFEPFCEELGNRVVIAIGEWMNQTAPGLLRCPRCGVGRTIDSWSASPPIGFGNLFFRFWNWPPFDLPAWKTDVPALVQRGDEA